MRLSTHTTTPGHSHNLLFHWHCLDDGALSKLADGTPLMFIRCFISQRAACLQMQKHGSRARTSRHELRAMGGHGQESGWGVQSETEQCVCKQKNCSWVADPRCVLQDLCSAHFSMSKPKRPSSPTSGCSLSFPMSNKATKHFSLPSPCLPICVFRRRPM